MTAIELDAYRADIARDILNIGSYSLLDKIKKLIIKEGKKKQEEAADAYTPRTHDEIIADFKEALEETRLSMEGKIAPRPIEELISEL